MKKINILLLLLAFTGIPINSQEASTSSTSSTAQTPSNKSTSNSSPSGKSAPHLLKIPMAIEKTAHAPDNVIEKNTLYLDVNNQFTGILFAEFIHEQLAANKPVIFGVTTTKINGTYTYRIYEAYEVCRHFYREDLSRNRYRIRQSQVPLEPTDNQPIINPILFFMLYDENKPVKYIGSDHDLFEGTKEQRARLKNTLTANNGMNPPIDMLMNLYSAYEENLDIAEKYLRQAADKGSVDAMYDLGIMYHLQKDFRLAELYLKKAIDKGSVDAMNVLGDVYKKQNKLDLAIKYYKLAADKENVSAMMNLAFFYYKQDMFDLAEHYLKKAVAKGDVTAMLKLGMHYYKINKIDDAERYLKQAADKEDLEAMIALAKVYVKQNKLDDAERYLKQAADREHALALNDLGSLYYRQGKFNVAHHHWQRALQALESHPDPKLEKTIKSNLEALKTKQARIIEKS